MQSRETGLRALPLTIYLQLRTEGKPESYNELKSIRKEVRLMLCSVRESGQGLVQYAFLLVMIAVVVIAVLLILGPTIGNVFTKLNSQLVSF